MLNLLHKGGEPVSRETQGLATYLVPLSRLVDNSYQPRQYNDPDHVLGIAKSLIDLQPQLPETRGLQQVPMGRIVRWADSWQPPAADYDNPEAIHAYILDPQFVVEMAFGHSRRLAFDVLANGVRSIFPHLEGTEQVAFNGREFDPATYAEMPIVLVPLTDKQLWQQAIVENAARRDISAIEKAQALQRATSELGMTITDAAAAIDMSRSAASNLLRLLELPEAYQEAIVNGAMSETHGRTLLTLKGAWHLVKGSPQELGGMTRKDLEAHVGKLIASCVPLAPEKRTSYRIVYGYNNDLGTRHQDPPAWPYDWKPAEQADVVGACEGCALRMTFAGEAGPRCAQVVARGTKACYDVKGELWTKQQMELQRQAIQRPAAASEPMDQSITEHTSTAPAGSVSRETPAAPTAKVFAPEKPSEAPTWFAVDSYSAPKALIDKGLCGPEKCACFVVAFNQFVNGKNVRPDPAAAPNMCYGCTSAQRLARHKQELEHGDMNALRAAIKAQNAACTELLREAFYHLTAQDLWHNSAFMRDMMRAGSLASGMGQRVNQLDSMDALTIQEMIWLYVAGSKCRDWSNVTVSGDSQHWNMVKVQAWLKKIGAEFANPKYGVWAELLQPAAPAVSEIDEL